MTAMCTDVSRDVSYIGGVMLEDSVPKPSDWKGYNWWFYNPYCCWRKKCLLYRCDGWGGDFDNGNVYRCFTAGHNKCFHICGRLDNDFWSTNPLYRVPEDRSYYRCPITTRASDGRIVCAMTGYVLDIDDDLPHFEGTEPHQEPYVGPRRRRRRRRFEQYLPRTGPEGIPSDDADLRKDCDDHTVYSLLLRGEVELLAWHFGYLDEWLTTEEIYEFFVAFCKLTRKTAEKDNRRFFCKNETNQIRNAIYTAVTQGRDKRFITQYRLFTNLVRNLGNILATIKPSVYSHLAL